MRKLTEIEKEELEAKIAAEQTQKHQKEQKLIAHKHQYKQYGGSSAVIGGSFKMGSVSGQSHSSRLRAAKRDKAFNHVFEKSEPLKKMKFAEAEKAVLRKKIAAEKQ